MIQIMPKTTEEVLANKAEFCRIIKEKVKRPGIDKLMNWLETTDFFTAPASTRFHEAYAGGLCEHSLVVYENMVALNEKMDAEHKMSDESVALTALFHDLCKANFYKAGTRNVKNEETGAWEKVPTYTVEDRFPYGHSEKSVFLMERFIRLSVSEAVTIRCHMGFSDESFKGGAYFIGNAFEMYPEAVNLHLADLQATYQKQVLRFGSIANREAFK